MYYIFFSAGDYVTEYATPKATLQDRKRKGYSISWEMRANWGPAGLTLV